MAQPISENTFFKLLRLSIVNIFSLSNKYEIAHHAKYRMNSGESRCPVTQLYIWVVRKGGSLHLVENSRPLHGQMFLSTSRGCTLTPCTQTYSIILELQFPRRSTQFGRHPSAVGLEDAASRRLKNCGVQKNRLRWLAEGIFTSERYFATVRRAMMI
jgi:hypothetical protein